LDVLNVPNFKNRAPEFNAELGYQRADYFDASRRLLGQMALVATEPIH
jgi:hypothetical protein